jgi:formate hydrogenlyase transcriptional activator
MKPSILYVDDEMENLTVFQATYRQVYNVMVATSAKAGLHLLKEIPVTVVIADYKMPEMDGIEFLKQCHEQFPDITRIILTAVGDRDVVVKSINEAQISHFVMKPWTREEMDRVIRSAIANFELVKTNRELVNNLEVKNQELTHAYKEIKNLKAKVDRENENLKRELNNEVDANSIIGAETSLKDIINKINQVATLNTLVLITGETGTGKDLIAKAIHARSRRADKPFVKLNCAALPSTLIESELFGFEKGAFTGANNGKLGLFEIANGGTIFLDEIGDIPIEFQTKLLRVLQDSEFYKIGGVNPISVDVRVIAATNRNLKREVMNGTFREDLFYRLNIFPVKIPPLRQRIGDIRDLTYFFLKKFEKKLAIKIKDIPERIWKAFESHSWPGNIRELEGVIERSVITSVNGVFNLYELQSSENADSLDEVDLPLREMERRYIVRILNKVNWKISGKGSAAEILKVNHNTLRSAMKRLGIQFKSAKQKSEAVEVEN